MDSNNSKDDNKNTDIQNIPDNFIPLLKLFFEGKKMREFQPFAFKSFEEYIAKQVLASSIEILDAMPKKTKFYFENNLEDGDLVISF